MKNKKLFITLGAILCVGAVSYCAAQSTRSNSKLENFADFSYVMSQKKLLTPEEMRALNATEVDVRSRDCSNWDFSGYMPGIITYDTKTTFPTEVSKLPAHFNAAQIMEIHKNPGLNVRKLHEQGIDGRGVAMAIIDQPLAPHQEYNDNLVQYEKFLHYKGQDGSMHGSAVASIAVGKTVGVAPKAKLYYFAADLADGKYEDDDTKSRTAKYFAQALDRIIEINKSLSEEDKIVVVSVSAAPSWSRDPEVWDAALERAKASGIFVTTTMIDSEYKLHDNGLFREVFDDPDNTDSYGVTNWQKGRQVSEEQIKTTLAFPMDHRTTASPTGNTDYVHYSNGGWSWMKPFEAGMYVLAKQVDRNITPEKFFEIGLQTGTYSEKAQAMIINPVALINALTTK